MAVITLGPVTATANPSSRRRLPAAEAAPGSAGVTLDGSATTHCRRRIHLEHDPAAVAAPRALPDPSLAQRRTDAAEYRARIGALLAEAAGPAWHAVSPDTPDRVARTAAAVAVAPSCSCACPRAATSR